MLGEKSLTRGAAGFIGGATTRRGTIRFRAVTAKLKAKPKKRKRARRRRWPAPPAQAH